MTCGKCNDLGYLFPWLGGTGLACVEFDKCDVCDKEIKSQ